MLCAYTRPRYQVNVYRILGPMVMKFDRECTYYMTQIKDVSKQWFLFSMS